MLLATAERCGDRRAHSLFFSMPLWLAVMLASPFLTGGREGRAYTMQPLAQLHGTPPAVGRLIYLELQLFSAPPADDKAAKCTTVDAVKWSLLFNASHHIAAAATLGQCAATVVSKQHHCSFLVSFLIIFARHSPLRGGATESMHATACWPKYNCLGGVYLDG